MSWKGRLGVIGLAWITVPWTWGIVEQQRRLRGRDDEDETGVASGHGD